MNEIPPVCCNLREGDCEKCSRHSLGRAGDEKCRMTSFVACQNCGMYRVVPDRGHVEGSGCWYDR